MFLNTILWISEEKKNRLLRWNYGSGDTGQHKHTFTAKIWLKANAKTFTWHDPLRNIAFPVFKAIFHMCFSSLVSDYIFFSNCHICDNESMVKLNPTNYFRNVLHLFVLLLWARFLFYLFIQVQSARWAEFRNICYYWHFVYKENTIIVLYVHLCFGCYSLFCFVFVFFGHVCN